MSIVKLENLKDDVISWKYNCKPTKRIFIPKANRKLRLLGIPSIIDKILQVAIKLIIEPECERIFHKNSFGFRPKKSVYHALLKVNSIMDITWIIKEDIKGYFDNIDYKIMAKIVQE